MHAPQTVQRTESSAGPGQLRSSRKALVWPDSTVEPLEAATQQKIRPITCKQHMLLPHKHPADELILTLCCEMYGNKICKICKNGRRPVRTDCHGTARWSTVRPFSMCKAVQQPLQTPNILYKFHRCVHFKKLASCASTGHIHVAPSADSIVGRSTRH